MSSEQSVPDIRFDGFNGEWTEKLLFEVAEKISVGIATSSSKHFVSLSNGVPFIKNQDIKNGVIDTENLEAISNEFDKANKNKRLKTGDILTVRTGYPGLSAVLPSSLNNAQSFTTLITRINCKEVNPFFVSTYINSDSGKIQMNGMQAGGAQKNINANTLKNFAIYYPNLLEEQTKVANYFKSLDNLINQHQKKHDKLSNLKKAMLEKMFPKAGETVPEIRFDGFSGEWESKEIRELADIVRGASPRPIDDPKWFDKSSKVGWLRIRDVTEQDGRIHHLEQRISKEGESKTRVLHESHLLLSIAASVGKPVINYVSTGVHDGFLIFRQPNFDMEFMYQWLKSFESKWQQYGQPGSQVNLNSDIVKNQVVLVPCRDEQILIGDYFKKLDRLINQHKQQITKLKNIKQACLDKMFV
ncbi:restriction endonuclease subunit S [Vibrio campbellii]|uniref:restriction endonuclease subunit S n=1 Tax=Vibrio campbellii TaxID=680 RepID=UPI003D0AA02F